jgi:hypothetical protein
MSLWHQEGFFFSERTGERHDLRITWEVQEQRMKEHTVGRKNSQGVV